MKGILIFVLGLLVGGGAAITFGGGAMMGAGAGMGLVTGVCSVVDTAVTSGLLSADQIDALLAQTAKQFSATADAATAQSADSAEKCAAVMAKLRTQ
jgi:hypothetical protein